jgi:hypothetical protein
MMTKHEKNKANIIRLSQQRRAFLQVIQINGYQNNDDLSFIDEESAFLLGKQLHDIISNIVEARVQDWEKAKEVFSGFICKYDYYIIFTNRWEIGALAIRMEVLKVNVDAIYRTVGPDFYCATPDLSHGFIFDKNEYYCSTRIW